MENNSENKKQIISAKVLILGISTVGKTSILIRYSDNLFLENTRHTVALSKSYYKGAEAVLIVFAKNNYESFLSVKNWIYDIKENAKENIIKLLIGNKNDVENNEIPQHELEDLISDFGLEYIETSAKTGENVKEAFEAIAFKINDKFNIEMNNTNESLVNLKIENKTKKNSCCRDK